MGVGQCEVLACLVISHEACFVGLIKIIKDIVAVKVIKVAIKNNCHRQTDLLQSMLTLFLNGFKSIGSLN